MTYYPSHDEYKKLYARYTPDVGRPLSSLIEFGGDPAGKNILDLCAGGCEMSAELACAGARSVVAVDESAEMMGIDPSSLGHFEGEMTINPVLHSGPVTKCWMSVEGFLDDGYGKKFGPFDAVYCRQGVNYWLRDWATEKLARVMSPGAAFIFNTFNSCPTTLVKKEYRIEGRWYLEISYAAKTGAKMVVHHVQCMEDHAPHTTTFDWISREEFLKMLKPYFDVEIKTDGGTDIYRCIRKMEAEKSC